MGIERHRPQPLLAPRSIAVIGAASRAVTEKRGADFKGG